METELAEMSARLVHAKLQEAEWLRQQRAIVTTLPTARGSTSPDSQLGSPLEPTPHTLVTLMLHLDAQRRADVQAAAEREERLMAALASRPTSRPTSPRPTSPQGSSPLHTTSDLVAMMTLLEQHRRDDRQEANQNLERMEARHRAQWETGQAGGQPACARYHIGTALATTVTKFTGDGDQNWDEWLQRFERMTRAHNVPESGWPNELSIKLEGLAGNFVQTQFPSEGPGATWVQLTTALQRQFGRRYEAASAWRALNTATRLPNESGLAALQRVRNLTRALTVLGVPSNPGPNERMCYVLQNQLPEAERIAWMALANASMDASETAIRDKEAAAATALHGFNRQSIAVEERDEWFQPQRLHLETFLENQGKTLGGRGQPAQAAPIDARGGPTPVAIMLPEPPIEASAGPGDTSIRSNARLCAAIVAWDKRAGATARPPPSYHGDGPGFQAQNQATFDRRKANNECFKCKVGQLVPGQRHYDCVFHGRDATDAEVYGAGGASRMGGRGSVSTSCQI